LEETGVRNSSRKRAVDGPEMGQYGGQWKQEEGNKEGPM